MIVRLAAIAVCLAAAVTAACTNPFVLHYEYEEQVYLSVDGSATVVVDASLPALVALRGVTIDPSPASMADRDAIRRVLEAARCRVTNVSRPWTREGRRFIQVTVTIDDVAQLPVCGLLSWSSYALAPIKNDGGDRSGGLRYTQTVGAAMAADPGAVTWTGRELVAFKVHVPSRIRFHNVKRLDGTDGAAERGNILTWEQRFSDRRAGKPVSLVVDMDETSILHTTLWIFGGAFAAAVLALVLIIWMVVRRGRNVKLGSGELGNG